MKCPFKIGQIWQRKCEVPNVDPIYTKVLRISPSKIQDGVLLVDFTGWKLSLAEAQASLVIGFTWEWADHCQLPEGFSCVH